jgi:hypothetical protein
MSPGAGIGGFLGLDPSVLGRPPCPGARTAFSTGRACLAAILDLVRPRVVYLPRFVCPVVHRVVAERGCRCEWFGLDQGLRPQLPAALPADAMVLVVNYFGLLGPVVDRVAGESAATVVIDDAQAFFHRPGRGVWAFNSARKFFGVPDGAWLFGPASPPCHERARPGTAHLEFRDAPHAFARYRSAEADRTDEPLGASLLTRALLGHTDLDGVAAVRRANHAHLHRRLAAHNRLQLPLGDDAVPLCYPFLPRRVLSHAQLHAQRIWVPRFWPDMPRAGEHAWTDELAEDLLPLPVDQRYGPDDMDVMASVILGLLQERTHDGA